MACSLLTLFVPVSITKVTIFISVFFLLPVKTVFDLGQTDACMPFCDGSHCITVNRDRGDFKAAEEACRDRNGELMTLQLKTDETILDILSQELYGSFWIGLRLPAGACSNLSAPFRGYEWISGNMQSSFDPSPSTWEDSVKVCHPHCVALSNGQTWTERLCSDMTDGYLCKTRHKDACQAQELTETVFFPSKEGCSSGPCEQMCKDVKGGYECSCFKGYVPDKKKPRECKLHCGQQKCPALCVGQTSECFCPEGFIIDSRDCKDIDECQMEQCHQECKNTFGSFACSCREGYVLKDQVKCVKKAQGFLPTTPVAVGSVKPAVNNDTMKGSSVHSGGFVWLWIFLAVLVVVSIAVVRFYVVKRQKRREQNSIGQVTVTVDNIKC